MEEEYRNEDAEENKLRTDAYVEAIKKSGMPKEYIKSGNPPACVLEDIVYINKMSQEESKDKEQQESYERWCRKWSED